MSIPVVDLFAGPGGLGEGFSSFRYKGKRGFKVALAIECNGWARETLALRSFFREFDDSAAPEAYYEHLRGHIPRAELYRNYARQAEAAEEIAWQATLGEVTDSTVNHRIRLATKGAPAWILAGGPPCQAYSIVGRSRTGGISPNDRRVYLYNEYLKVLAEHRPAAFVFENVKGLLSSRLQGASIVERILTDLKCPSAALANSQRSLKRHANEVSYTLSAFVEPENNSLVLDEVDLQPLDYLIRSENYGIPQCRHRLIVLGVRSDLPRSIPTNKLQRVSPVPLSFVLNSLPRLRGGLSKQADSPESWKQAIAGVCATRWFHTLRRTSEYQQTCDVMSNIAGKLRSPKQDRGSEYIPTSLHMESGLDWYHDPRLGGVCNHSSRAHIPSDLQRYFFMACYASVHGKSPSLKDLPKDLLPDHQNVMTDDANIPFADRFRVQVRSKPATTITSHVAKDGHYYIHYDPRQCRSLTVREAARVQTFPDNYFFCGPRTEQYIQVGNAVPPLLANKIAAVVYDLLRNNELTV